MTRVLLYQIDKGSSCTTFLYGIGNGEYMLMLYYH